jgi:hypothetical protein
VQKLDKRRFVPPLWILVQGGNATVFRNPTFRRAESHCEIVSIGRTLAKPLAYIACGQVPKISTVRAGN